MAQSVLSTHPEVGGTGRQDHPVSSDKLPVSGESDVHQTLLLQETVHDGEDGGGVVVPFQTELLAHPVTSSSTRSHDCVSVVSQCLVLKIFCLFLNFILGAGRTDWVRYKSTSFSEPVSQFLSSRIVICFPRASPGSQALSELRKRLL